MDFLYQFKRSGNIGLALVKTNMEAQMILDVFLKYKSLRLVLKLAHFLSGDKYCNLPKNHINY